VTRIRQAFSLKVPGGVHAIVRHAHHDDPVALDAIVHDVALYPLPPIARADVVTGRRRTGSLGQACKGRVQQVQVMPGLLDAPPPRRVKPDVLQIAQRRRGKQELRACEKKPWRAPRVQGARSGETGVYVRYKRISSTAQRSNRGAQ